MNKSVEILGTVVSGQQVGLLGGPLYVLYKIIGILHLAHAQGLEPVYWLEGNDADLNEIRVFYGLTNSGELKKYVWDPISTTPPQIPGQPIGNYRVNETLINLYQEYFSNIPTTPHSARIQELVFDSYREGKTLMEAVEKFFSNLFSEAGLSLVSFNRDPKRIYPLRWFRSDNSKFRKFSQNLLQQEIIATSEGEQCQAFALIGKKREALFKKEGKIITRGKVVVDITKTTLLPMVWNRSLLQDDFLHARYYVAGPGEIKYLKKLQSRYEDNGIIPAKAMPRMSATLVDEEMLEKLRILGFPLDEFIAGVDGFNSQTTLYSRWQAQLESRYFESKESISDERNRKMCEKDQEIARFRKSVQDVRAIKQEEKKLYLEIKHVLGKKRAQYRADTGSTQNILHQVGQYLCPYPYNNVHFPQERLHNIVTFLNRYGIGMVKEIYDQHNFTSKIIKF